MKENIVQMKSYAFAIKIVNTFKVLQQDSKEFVLSKQLLRAGTSIGANIEEAIGGQSRKDFFAKLTIAYKEARETKYWIRLLTDTKYLDKETSRILLEDIEELLGIIGSIQKTIRNS
ncbi:four helix bundle protein [Arenibacter algicola]|nr:four helix bundle protein [Arenibacter algicola]